MPAGDRQNTRHHHLKHRMPDAVRIAAIRHCFGEPQANTMLALRLPQEQQAAIGRLVDAGKIDGEFLASDRWQVERKRRIVIHSGCGAGLRYARQLVGTPVCYVNWALFATAVSEIYVLAPSSVRVNAPAAGRPQTAAPAGGRLASGLRHTDKAARSLCPTSLPRNGGSSYSEEPGVEIL